MKYEFQMLSLCALKLTLLDVLGLRAQDLQLHSRYKAAAGAAVPGCGHGGRSDSGHGTHPYVALGTLL